MNNVNAVVVAVAVAALAVSAIGIVLAWVRMRSDEKRLETLRGIADQWRENEKTKEGRERNRRLARYWKTVPSYRPRYGI